MILIQTDGGFRSNPDYMGVGVTISDHNSLVVYEYSEWYEGGSAQIAELMALLKGIKVAADNNLEASIVTDCQMSLKYISNKGIYILTEIEDLVYQARLLSYYNPKITFLWSPRDLLERAHNLATRAMEEYRKLNNLSRPRKLYKPDEIDEIGKDYEVVKSGTIISTGECKGRRHKPVGFKSKRKHYNVPGRGVS